MARQTTTGGPTQFKRPKSSVAGARQARTIGRESKYADKHREKENWVPIRRCLLESWSWRLMSFAARRCLDRIMLEHLTNGGQRNGDLVATFNDFVAYGVRRNSIATALRELEALGLIEFIQYGSPSADLRQPHIFRLTFVETKNPIEVPATDEWRHLTTKANAQARVRRFTGKETIQSASLRTATQKGNASLPKKATDENGTPASLRVVSGGLG